MRKMKWMSGLVLFAFATLSLQAAVVIISEDFEGDTVGSDPAVYAISQPAGVDFVVVDSGSAPVDPFGGEGNQSLYHSKTGLPPGYARFTTASQTLETGDVKVSLKYYLDSAVISTGFRDIIGMGDASIGTAVRLYVKGDRFMINGSTSMFSWAGLSTDQVWNIEITLDASEQKWSVTVNGTPIKNGGNKNTIFRYDTPSSAANGVNMISFMAYGVDGCNTSVFYDDVVMTTIPEPAIPACAP